MSLVDGHRQRYLDSSLGSSRDLLGVHGLENLKAKTREGTAHP